MQPSKVRKVSKAEARRAVKTHEKAMHGAKKMKAGGPTSLDSLAAHLRCIPVPDHAAKILFITSCCSC